MSETTHDLTQRAEMFADLEMLMGGIGSSPGEWASVHREKSYKLLRDLRSALVQAEQREAVLERIIEIYEAQLARVEDSQYAKPLATAPKNEVIP